MSDTRSTAEIVIKGKDEASAAFANVSKSLEGIKKSVDVLKGIMFVMILLFETLYGRFRVFQPPLPQVVETEEPKPAPRAPSQEAAVP